MATKKKTKVRARDRKPVNLVQIACYVTPEQRDALREMSAKTLIPQQALLRLAITRILKEGV